MQRSALARLLMDANRVVPAEVLIEQLWGQVPPPRARATLQVHMANLRKLLKAEVTTDLPEPRLEGRARGYVLHVADDELDVARFRMLCQAGRTAMRQGDNQAGRELLAEGLALWRGQPFPDLDGVAEALPEVAGLAEERLSAVQDRIHADLALGHGADLVAELDVLTASYPLRETFQAQRIVALYRAGRQAEALEAYREVRRLLRDELGVDPHPELRRLETAVLRQDPTLDAPKVEAHIRRLPAPAHRLVGRREHLSALATLIEDPHVRLVTILGPGGSGKSRLALEVAALAQEDPGRLVHFVQLGSLTDHRLVMSTVARVLGLGSVPGTSLLDQLSLHLEERTSLIVLDNFEHLLPAATELSALLSVAPDLTVLATSRIPLRISAEHEYDLPPLTLPSEGPLAALDVLGQNEAVALFVERATSVRAEFSLTEDVAATVVAICRRLDGLPLALELAAARVKVAGAEELLARLDARLDVLTGGPRDLLPRQRTLRATIEWSHDLLGPADQELFAQLAVFAGGCTLDAARAVLAAGVDGARLLDRAEDLVTHSLLRARRSRDGSTRLWMLETIREFAAERLDATPGGLDIRRQHAQHYLALAESAAPRLVGGDQLASLGRLREEDENLRAALAWCAQRGEREMCLRLAGALGHYWELTGALDEGRRWLDLSLTMPGGAAEASLLTAHSGAGSLAFAQGDYARAEHLHGVALELARRLHDLSAEAFALNNLGAQASQTGRVDEAHRLFSQAVILAEDVGDSRVAGIAKHNLGLQAFHGGAIERAADLFQQALLLFRHVGDMWLVANTTTGLALCHQLRGDLVGARRELLDSLDIATGLGVTLFALEAIEGLAVLAARSDAAYLAVRYLAGATAGRRLIGAPLEAAEAARTDAMLVDLRARLGDERFQRAWAEGTGLALPELVAEARA
jgi:predicted ATPase/DNA-binding SARP family transcriptional activator